MKSFPIKLSIILSALLFIVMFSCTESDVIESDAPEQVQEISSKEVQESEDNLVEMDGPLEIDGKINPSYYDVLLTYEDLKKIGVNVEGKNLEEFTFILSHPPVQGRTMTGPCSSGVDSRSRDNCCSTNAIHCSNATFRANGCFQWKFELTEAKFYRWFNVNNSSSSSGQSFSYSIARGCNLYEPHSIVDLNTGQVLAYLCTGPGFDRRCKATIKVRTYWQYRINFGPAQRCGENELIFHWPGTPACPMDS